LTFNHDNGDDEDVLVVGGQCNAIQQVGQFLLALVLVLVLALALAMMLLLPKPPRDEAMS
jgi:proteasome assembly chaperone (PAC2) family protein